MIANSDITFVIQGPVQALPGRDQPLGVTAKCIASIRQFVPGAKIILSTWQGQDCSALQVDTLLLNQDPGANIVSYAEDGTPGRLNFNRQIVSTAAGLREVTTPYAVKIRSDNFLTGNGFITAQQAYPHRLKQDSVFQERVVVNTSYFRRYAEGQRVILHPSDFFYFGRTEDLLKIWDLPLFADRVFDPAKAGQKQYDGAPVTATHAEQCYCRHWLALLDENAPTVNHRHDKTAESLIYWDRFMASNFVVLEPEQIGLGLIERFIPKAKRPNEMSHYDWLKLYKQYCDPSIDAKSLHNFLTVGWRRAIKFPFSYLKFKIAKPHH